MIKDGLIIKDKDVFKINLHMRDTLFSFYKFLEGKKKGLFA